VKRLTLACCCLAAGALAAPVPRPAGDFKGPGWGNPIDPDKDCEFSFARDSLTIEVPAKTHELVPILNLMNAPRLLRAVEGDFRAEVRVSGSFAPPQGARTHTSGGLLVEAGDERGSLLRVECGAENERVDGGPFTGLQFFDRKTTWEENIAGPGSEGWHLPKRPKAAFLRLERRGDEVTGAASADGKRWGPVGHGDKAVRVRLPKKVRVGLFAASTSAAPVKVAFDQFKLTPLKGSVKGVPAVRAAAK
jgi:hypothetical protein